jgi:hypothetical protein
MNHPTDEMRVQLWEYVHAALDRRELASQDALVLDMLVESPELAPALDEVLVLERDLLSLAHRKSTAAPWRLLVGRGRAASLAAAMLLALTPFVFGPTSEPLSPSSTNSPLGRIEVVAGSENAAEINAPSRPIPTIHSFELTVRSQATRAPESTSTTPRASTPRATIRTLTASRTRTAPNSARAYR